MSQTVMRDMDEHSFGYVPTKISELWKADKRLKSLYNTVINIVHCAINTLIPSLFILPNIGR